MNYPPYSNDPNDPHSQPTTAGSYPQWGQQAPPPPPFPQQPGQFLQSGVPSSQQLPKKKWSKWKKIGCGCLTLTIAFFTCIITVGAFAGPPPKTEVSSAPTQEATKILTKKPTPTPTLSPTPRPTETPTPTPTATPTPSPTPKPVPTQAPVQQSVQQQPVQQPAPPPAQLFVNFTGASAVDNSSGSVSVHTLAGAALTISIKYCSGSYATSKSLQGTVYADSSGNYTWTWTPNTKCKGTATAYVNASLNGQSASNSTDFTVS